MSAEHPATFHEWITHQHRRRRGDTIGRVAAWASRQRHAPRQMANTDIGILADRWRWRLAASDARAPITMDDFNRTWRAYLHARQQPREIALWPATFYQWLAAHQEREPETEIARFARAVLRAGNAPRQTIDGGLVSTRARWHDYIADAAPAELAAFGEIWAIYERYARHDPTPDEAGP